MTTQMLPDYVVSRRIGDATVTVISEGTLPWALEIQAPEAEWRRAMPEADESGQVLLGLNLVHISIGDASILVDPGFDDPVPASQQELAAAWPGIIRTEGLQAALAGLGIAPGDITHVLITHAHGDHYAGVAVEQDGRYAARYPHARHFIGRGDWDDNPRRQEPESELAIRLGAIERLGLLESIDAEHDVVPGVTMIHTPGETPGHSIVRVRSNGESFYYLGDLFHHACEVAHIDWVPPQRDATATRASRARLIAEAVPSRAILVYTHEQFPAWGRIMPSGSGYQWERI